jgi:hypothetical protein
VEVKNFLPAVLKRPRRVPYRKKGSFLVTLPDMETGSILQFRAATGVHSQAAPARAVSKAKKQPLI